MLRLSFVGLWVLLYSVQSALAHDFHKGLPANTLALAPSEVDISGPEMIPVMGSGDCMQGGPIRSLDDFIPESVLDCIRNNPCIKIEPGWSPGACVTSGTTIEQIRYFNTQIALNPDDATLYNQRGVKEFLYGWVEQARQDFEQAIRLDPKFDPAYYNRAIVKMARHQPRWGLGNLFEAIRLSPSTSIYYFARGVAFELDCKKEKALVDYATALRLNPDDEAAGKGYASINTSLTNKLTPCSVCGQSTTATGGLQNSTTTATTVTPSPPLSTPLIDPLGSALKQAAIAETIDQRAVAQAKAEAEVKKFIAARAYSEADEAEARLRIERARLESSRCYRQHVAVNEAAQEYEILVRTDLNATAEALKSQIRWYQGQHTKDEHVTPDPSLEEKQKQVIEKELEKRKAAAQAEIEKSLTIIEKERTEQEKTKTDAAGYQAARAAAAGKPKP